VSCRHRARPAVLALLITLVCAATRAPAQTGRISGTVTDSVTAQPVPRAEVSVVGTGLRVATSETGTYVIDGVRAGTYVLDVRRIGFVGSRRTGVAVTADATTTVDFRLAPSVFRLQEVVVTGVLGEVEGVKLPFTVGRVTADQAPVPPPNAIEAIQGKIAGVTVVPTGQPGGGTNIQLRTPTSINKSNSPLIAVDGTILGTTAGSSADLNSLDIERYEVVKGAAGASLYGSRAQSGVIQIFTRRGDDIEEGRTQVTLRSEFGGNALVHKVRWARYHSFRMDPGQTTYVDTLGNPVGRDGRVDEPQTSGGFRFQDNPYPDPVYDQVEAFFDPGSYLTNEVTIAHRAPSSNWFGSMGNHRSTGVIDGHGGYRRNDVRLNLDHRPRRDVTLSFSGYYSRSVRDEMYGAGPDPNPFFDLINIAPDVNLRQADPDGSQFMFQPDEFGIRPNPLYKLSTEDNRTGRARFLGNVTLQYTPAGWLSFEGKASYDRSDRFESFFLDRGLKSDDAPTGDPGLIIHDHEIADAINASASVTLTRQYGATSVRTMLRALLEREDHDSTAARGDNLAVAGVPDLTNAQERSVNSTTEQIRATGYFAITSVDYAGKLILDGLVRRDGSSLFGQRETWHTYGRVSAAYRLAEERWWPFEQISEFKLRFSRGTAGGRPNFPDEYDTYEIDEAGNVTKETLGNPFLKPEHTTETEYGLDMVAFGKMSVQLSYARSTVRNELIAVPLLAPLGYPEQWQNAGTVVGNTYEATIEAQLLRKPSLSWRLGLVADRSRHRITEYDPPCLRIGLTYRCAGEPLGVMYGARFLRHPDELPAVHAGSRDQFQINDDGLLVPVGSGNNYTDGVAKSLWGTNVSIDGVSYPWGRPLRLQDPASGGPAVVRIGDSNADFRFGLSNQVTWKNLVLYGLVDVQVGGQVYNATKQRMYQWWRSADEDQVGKPDALKKPPAYYSALYNADDANEWFVEPGGFVKLREVSVRYRVPVQHLAGLRSLGIRGASLSLVGRNLFTITDYSGYDPEVRSSDPTVDAVVRLDDFTYPRFRTVTGAVLLEF
jgi:TonB-linked SusC/RagA family outer membrane protein